MDAALPCLRVGLVGLGMIAAETYLPLFAQLRRRPLFAPETGPVRVELAAVASRTGRRLPEFLRVYPELFAGIRSHDGPAAVDRLLQEPIDLVCIATPDDHHFKPALAALQAGKHVVVEKPSVLRLEELDRLEAEVQRGQRLAKVVYHKLFDPDHKRLRTLVADGLLHHANHGYCSLLEPKSISGNQFAEWISGRNPASYVAVHYVKLIDFTFFGRGEAELATIKATGQRGLVGSADGPTWDSVQLQLGYRYPDGREAAFDLHTSWVNPENFPGYVEQEVRFRFDNGVWTASQRQRGVEVCVEGLPPERFKTTPNHHYNAEFLEPWGERRRRGYGLEAIQRTLEEAALLEYGGPSEERRRRWEAQRALGYNDLAADRRVVAATQGVEAILARHASGRPGAVARVNGPEGGLALELPGQAGAEILHRPRV